MAVVVHPIDNVSSQEFSFWTLMGEQMMNFTTFWYFRELAKIESSGYFWDAQTHFKLSDNESCDDFRMIAIVVFVCEC